MSKNQEPVVETPMVTEYGSSEETRLLERCRRGDLEAFDVLLGLHQDTVYRTAYRLMGDAEEAADLAQDVLITAFRKIEQFRGQARFSTWLYRITVNLANNRWKSASRKPRIVSIDRDGTREEDSEESPIQVADDNPGPREQAAGREVLEALNHELTRLDPVYREAMVLRHVENLSYEEIAEVLDVNLGTVKSRLARGREALRKALGPQLDEYLGG